MKLHPLTLALAATAGFLSATPARPIWQDLIVGAFIFAGYALPEAYFLAGKRPLEATNRHLQDAGFLGTVIPMVLGLPIFLDSAERALATFALALVTTMFALVLILFNNLLEKVLRA